MPEMHFRQPWFRYSACGPFTTNKERINEFKETRDSRYIYQNELDKACFQNDMAYGDLKDLNRRAAADKLLHNKAFDIAKNLKYDGYHRAFASMVYKLFYKKVYGGAAMVTNKIISNKELAEELHKAIIRKFDKRKVHSPFIDNIWGADLEDMQLISKFNKSFGFLLCVIDIYSKYAWVTRLKDKKGITITNAFQNIFDESKCKPRKIWVDKGSEFYNRSIKS